VAQIDANELQFSVNVVSATVTPGKTLAVVPANPSRVMPLLVLVVISTSSAMLTLESTLNVTAVAMIQTPACALPRYHDHLAAACSAPHKLAPIRAVVLSCPAIDAPRVDAFPQGQE
jgi:hypothetical protein